MYTRYFRPLFAKSCQLLVEYFYFSSRLHHDTGAPAGASHADRKFEAAPAFKFHPVRKYLVIGLSFLMLAFTAKASKPVLRVFLVGDSIVKGSAPARYPLGGWGQIMPYHFRNSIQVLNRAIGGRSSKSFIEEGHWAKVLKDVKQGDYVFIEFGNNDQYPRLPKKYTDPDTTYQSFLKKYIRDTRKLGAIPVLVTMPIRMSRYKAKTGWHESHIQSTWKMPKETRQTATTYHDAMRKVAQETNTPFVDLNKLSRKKFTSLKFGAIKTYYNCCEPGIYPSYPKGHRDLEHNSVKGAIFLAACIASEIRRLQLPLAKYLKKDVNVAEKQEITTKLATTDITGKFTLMGADDKQWQPFDKETTLTLAKAGTDTILNFNVAVNHKVDGSGHNGKYLKAWPRIVYNFDQDAVNLNAYSYLRFFIKVKSNRENVIGTMMIISFAGTGAKSDYTIDIGKETKRWKEILVPIRNMMSLSGYPAKYWKSMQRIQFVIVESWYEDGTNLKLNIKNIKLLKTKAIR